MNVCMLEVPMVDLGMPQDAFGPYVLYIICSVGFPGFYCALKELKPFSYCFVCQKSFF